MTDWRDLLGIDAQDLQAYQMACRAVLMFVVSMFIIRISGLRLLGKQSAFDHLTVLMLGALLGRSIVAAQSLGGSILAAIIIVVLHRISAIVTFKSKAVGNFMKGEAVPIIKNTEWLHDNLAKTQVTKNDIEEAIRQELNTEDLSRIQDAFLERSGKITIIEKQ